MIDEHKHQLTEALKAVCHDLVAHYLPEEATHFGETWKSFWDITGCSHVEELPFVPPRSLSGAPMPGFGAPGHADHQNDSLDIISLASFTTIRLNHLSLSEYALAAVEKTITEVMENNNNPPHIQAFLDEEGKYFAARLRDLLNQNVRANVVHDIGDCGRGAQTKKNGIKRPKGITTSKNYFLQGLIKGEPFEIPAISKQEADDYTKEARIKYDFLIDERHWLIYSKELDTSIDISSMVTERRVLLWYALSHVDTVLSRELFLKQYSWNTALNDETLTKRIFDMRSQLGETVGKKMINNKLRNLSIPSVDWSYIWISNVENPFKSRLLHGIHIEEGSL